MTTALARASWQAPDAATRAATRRRRRSDAPDGAWFRLAVTVVAIVAAYHYSLASLAKAFSLDTPIAHVGLVPFVSLALAFVHRSGRHELPIHDRQLDWIIGLPLVVATVLANLLLPARLSTEFWTMRIDLLTLPFFVIGTVALVYGVRTVWRVRLAIGFLFFVWPWPYEYLVDRWLVTFTNLTIAALAVAVRTVPVATQVVGSDGSLFTIAHAGKNIEMSVASACSGANGLLGFLLVGGAFVVSMRGTVRRKLIWLATGSIVVWMLNVARIMIIFEAARRWGESVAIDGFHPFTGLVVFNLGVLTMVLAMPWFGLRMPPRLAPVADGQTPPPPPGARRISTRSLRLVVPKLVLALAVLTGATAVIGLRNDRLQDNDLVASSLGTPRLLPFARSLEQPIGWKLGKTGQFGWARKYFGTSSTWRRYTYRRNLKEAPEGLDGNVGVVADVIETSDRAALAAYGVEACYKFHDYRVSRQQSVSLGSGIVGGLLTWTEPTTDQTWTTLYWHWPVKTARGTRYERITLLVPDSPSNAFIVGDDRADALSRDFDLRVNDLFRGGRSSGGGQRIVQTSRFVVAFARDLIERRAAA